MIFNGQKKMVSSLAGYNHSCFIFTIRKWGADTQQCTWE